MNLKRFIFIISVGLVSGIIFTGFFIISDYVSKIPHEKERARLRDIANEVYPLINQCKSVHNESSILLKGKALVWDLKTGMLKENIWEIPYKVDSYDLPHDSWELKAKSSDRKITVFLIQEYTLEKIAPYNIGDYTGYRARYDIYVIYYPEKKIAGMHTIFADPPTSIVLDTPNFHIPYDIKTIVGDCRVIYSWIESLPRENSKNISK